MELIREDTQFQRKAEEKHVEDSRARTSCPFSLFKAFKSYTKCKKCERLFVIEVIHL